MQIYASYDEEPADVFEPLTAELYSEFYDIEMAGFTDDIAFYRAGLPSECHLLELGCGSGRLSRLLAAERHRVIGIDLSTAMLAMARRGSPGTVRHVNMDMRRIAFSRRFDAIVIAYNTLNLLADPNDLHSCLRGCHHHLDAGGHLLAHVHASDTDIPGAASSPSFGFRMFDRPQGGKLIKETLLGPSRDRHRLEMTERYRVRPMTAGQTNADYSHTLSLCRHDRRQWLASMREAGFSIVSLFSSYDLKTAKKESAGPLLIHARKG